MTIFKTKRNSDSVNLDNLRYLMRCTTSLYNERTVALDNALWNIHVNATSYVTSDVLALFNTQYDSSRFDV